MAQTEENKTQNDLEKDEEVDDDEDDNKEGEKKQFNYRLCTVDDVPDYIKNPPKYFTEE